MATNNETSVAATCASSSLATGLGILLVRIVMGIIFIYYGGQHCFGFFGGRGIHSFASMLASDHFPVLPAIVWAWISGATEFFGGILLIIGLASRIISILLIIDMLAAMWAFHAGGFGTIDFNLALIAMAGLILIGGPGVLSVDTRVCAGMTKKQSPLSGQ